MKRILGLTGLLAMLGGCGGGPVETCETGTMTTAKCGKIETCCTPTQCRYKGTTGGKVWMCDGTNCSTTATTVAMECT